MILLLRVDLLLVFAASVVAGVLVVMLPGIQHGLWMLVVGVLVVLALFCAARPRAR